MLALGRYRHYKGNEYEVIGVARYSEGPEEMVVYRSVLNPLDLWVRPLDIFLEEADVAGERVSRFEYLGK
jgi:hypothetical protein